MILFALFASANAQSLEVSTPNFNIDSEVWVLNSPARLVYTTTANTLEELDLTTEQITLLLDDTTTSQFVVAEAGTTVYEVTPTMDGSVVSDVYTQVEDTDLENTFPSLSIGDIDGDGVEDFFNEEPAMVLIGSAGSSLTPLQNAHVLALGDLNNDGYDDVAIWQAICGDAYYNFPNESVIELYYGSESGLVREWELPLAGMSIYSMSLTQGNSSPEPELLILTATCLNDLSTESEEFTGYNLIRDLTSQPALQGLTSGIIPSTPSPTHLQQFPAQPLPDLNDDGVQELAIPAFDTLYLYGPQGFDLGSPTYAIDQLSRSYRFFMVDVNEDGDEDIVIHNNTTVSVWLTSEALPEPPVITTPTVPTNPNPTTTEPTDTGDTGQPPPSEDPEKGCGCATSSTNSGLLSLLGLMVVGRRRRS